MSNLFPLPPRVASVYLDGNLLDVQMENGVFALPIALRQGVHAELSFDIPNADLGRPYFVGKPGPFRDLPSGAKIFLGAGVVYLYCDQVARVKNALFRSRAPTGHVVVGVSHSGLVPDLIQGRTRVHLNLASLLDGPTLALWGLSFEPALVVAS